MTTVSMLPLSDDHALRLADAGAGELPSLLAAASAKRDAAWGRVATFSPKVFLPLTNICRNRCDYGPSLNVYPGPVFYNHLDRTAICEIVERHLCHGAVVDQWLFRPKIEGIRRQ